MDGGWRDVSCAPNPKCVVLTLVTEIPLSGHCLRRLSAMQNYSADQTTPILGNLTFGSYCKQAMRSGCLLYSGAAVEVILLDTASDLERWDARMVDGKG